MSKITKLAFATEDIFYGSVAIRIVGFREIYIENFLGILTFSEEKLKLLSRDGVVDISGHNMHIDCYQDNYLHLKGKICGISYIE